MGIRKFKVNVTVEKEIEIEVNTDIINEEFMENFSSYMWSVDDIEEIVEHVSHQTATRDGYFIEGVGEWPKSWERDKNLQSQGIHINYNDLDDNIEINIKEK